MFHKSELAEHAHCFLSDRNGNGTHHYHFKLYALDTELELNPGIDKAELLRQVSGHIQAEAELVGTYER